MKRKQRGFTLIEAMIAVALIGILVAIALPAYDSYVRKSRRADAQAFLMDLAVKQQQWLMDNRSYNSALEGSSGLVGAVPSNISSFFTVTVSAVTSTTFTLTATASGNQQKDADGAQSCAVLTLNQSGAKGPSVCWKR